MNNFFATRLESMEESSPDATNPLQRDLPSDPIEAMRALRALMAELDGKAGTDDTENFDQAATMLFGAEIAKRIGVEIARPVGIDQAAKNLAEMQKGGEEATVAEGVPYGMSLRLRSLRDSSRCTDREFQQYAQRLSLGHSVDVAGFINSREPLPRGTFGPTAAEAKAVDKKVQDVADWALGRKPAK